MTTAVQDLMSSPAVTCPADAPLSEATTLMDDRQIGSVVITDRDGIVGILTERDLLRASATQADPLTESVRRWMTADPDVLGLDDEVGAAWSGLTHHHYRHLPVVDHGDLVGVVSIRDLLAVAQIRPTEETGADIPRGLEGVVAAETSIGDVRGAEGFFHYRQYAATDLAATRSLEDVWQLLFDGELPDRRRSSRFVDEVAGLRELPEGVARLLPSLASLGPPLDVLRTAVSVLGAELGWRPVHDIGHGELRSQALRLCAVVPTILTAAHRLRHGEDPIPPRHDLSQAANYLWMLTGDEAPPDHVRAVEQYLILTIDHGFNASTFTARVIASTGADLAAAITGAIGALSGPLHGGSPSRALDMLDDIGTPDRADEWIRGAVARGDRIMGFGHRVYKTDDPRSLFLREVARSLGGSLVEFAEQTERTTVDVLAELKPGRQLYTNVEFFAGVVMHTCGIPRDMFTPTFASSRAIGWAAHVMEQAADNRLIRPAARYAGPPPPKRSRAPDPTERSGGIADRAGREHRHRVLLDPLEVQGPALEPPPLAGADVVVAVADEPHRVGAHAAGVSSVGVGGHEVMGHALHLPGGPIPVDREPMVRDLMEGPLIPPQPLRHTPERLETDAADHRPKVGRDIRQEELARLDEESGEPGPVPGVDGSGIRGRQPAQRLQVRRASGLLPDGVRHRSGLPRPNRSANPDISWRMASRSGLIEVDTTMRVAPAAAASSTSCSVSAGR